MLISRTPSQSYELKTGNDKRGSLKIVSEFPPAGIIGFGLSVSTNPLEIVLGDRSDDFVDVLPGLKLKWPQKHANQMVGIHVIVPETPRVQFTLQDIQHETDVCLLDLDKLFIGPVSLRFDLRPVNSQSMKPLSSLASYLFKGCSGLILLHDGPLPAT